MPGRRPLIILYLSSFFLAWSVTFGKMIGEAMTAWQKICIRALVAFPLLLLVAHLLGKKPFAIERRDMPRLVISGVVFGLHWSLFFISAEYSTAVMAQMLVFLAPLYSTIFDATIHGRGIRRSTLFHTLLVLIGLAMPFTLQGKHAEALGNLPLGIAIGAVSALMFATRNFMCGGAATGLIKRYDPVVIMAWQSAVIGVCWLPSLWLSPMNAAPLDWVYAVLIGIVATAMGHTLFTVGLKHLPAASATVVIALQPLWVAAYAWVTIREPVTPGLAIGGGLVILAVILESRASQKARVAEAKTSGAALE